MKAVVCRQYGSPELATLEEVPAPMLTEAGVRIRVHACSASFASLLVMEGKHQNRAPLPLVAGTEVAGIVMETGPEVTRFKPGDRVIAGVQSGGYAQQVVAPQQTVFHLPADVPFEIGAQFPTIYGTAYGALTWRAQVASGETVVVHGAAGGSGLAAVEVAKALGATVIATVGSEEKRLAVSEQGADHVINYRTKDWRVSVLELTGGRGSDVIYDPVGGAIFEESLRSIAPDGRLITMGFASGTIPSVPANIVLVKNISIIGVYWGYYFGWGRQPATPSIDARLRQAYEQLFAWTQQGKIRPRVHAVLPLADFKSALRMIADREAIGRVIMQPQ